MPLATRGAVEIVVGDCNAARPVLNTGLHQLSEILGGLPVPTFVIDLVNSVVAAVAAESLSPATAAS